MRATEPGNISASMGPSYCRPGSQMQYGSSLRLAMTDLQRHPSHPYTEKIVDKKFSTDSETSLLLSVGQGDLPLSLLSLFHGIRV